ncbi:hypothetical protein PENTCL1PPCAC_30233 [Pristionchus entomophagus]|uniref:Uncharacterized protein n=1 Tax=Pristionchus entomophagus TaxID=358040 RepID=A0AAV5UNR5_9BILA|nr:hypothetical protein PENTCL1PPCAC_30233 [Pristionchus entomophagus]
MQVHSPRGSASCILSWSLAPSPPPARFSRKWISMATYQTVDEDFKNQGGLCYQQMKQGFKKAQDLLQSEEGRATLSDMFQITPPFSAYDEVTPYDIDTFFSYLTYPFEASAQYNDPPPATLCEDFTVNGAAYDPLLAFTDDCR